jgi:hypothetical protein
MLITQRHRHHQESPHDPTPEELKLNNLFSSTVIEPSELIVALNINLGDGVGSSLNRCRVKKSQNPRFQKRRFLARSIYF